MIVGTSCPPSTNYLWKWGLGLASRINFLATAENYSDFEKVAIKDDVCACLFAKNSTANTWLCFKVLSKMYPPSSVLPECWTSNTNTIASWGSKSIQKTFEDVKASVSSIILCTCVRQRPWHGGGLLSLQLWWSSTVSWRLLESRTEPRGAEQ